MTNNDYNILSTLYKNKCTDEKDAFTIKQIQEQVNISVSTIRKSLSGLLAENYIAKGFQRWKASSYFITQKGINYINKF